MKPSQRKVGGNAGKGRKKGVPNKFTKDAREALQLAFDGIGGVPALMAWAKDAPSDFYKLWGKTIPQVNKVEGNPGQPVEIRVVFASEGQR